MYRTVLVPTDGSEAADRAVDQAYELAERFDATVHALFVVDVEGTYPFGPPVDSPLESVRAEGEAVTAEVVARAPDGVEAVPVVEEGVPHETILEYAEEHDIGLIVMGTHSRHGLDRFLLGSVTEHVMHRADRSVLVSHAGDEDERVSNPDEATDLATEALTEVGHESVTIEEEPLERGGYWILLAETDEASATVHVDRLSGAVRTTETE